MELFIKQTAKMLGVRFPTAIKVRADEVFDDR
jgi:hypothetical protein